VGQPSDDLSHELNLYAGIILGVIEHNPWKMRAVNCRGIVKLRAVLNWLRMPYTDLVFISSYQASALLGKILENICLSVDKM